MAAPRSRWGRAGPARGTSRRGGGGFAREWRWATAGPSRGAALDGHPLSTRHGTGAAALRLGADAEVPTLAGRSAARGRVVRLDRQAEPPRREAARGGQELVARDHRVAPRPQQVELGVDHLLL